MSIKTSPSTPPEPNGNCPECRGNGKIGMYWERCNTCDGTGSTPRKRATMSDASSSVIPNNPKSIDKELYQKITDICFENGSVTKPMVDQLYALFAKQLEDAYKKGYIDGGIVTLTQDTKGETK